MGMTRVFYSNNTFFCLDYKLHLTSLIPKSVPHEAKKVGSFSPRTGCTHPNRDF